MCKEMTEKDKDNTEAEERRRNENTGGLQAVYFSLMRLILVFVSDLPCFLLLIYCEADLEGSWVWGGGQGVGLGFVCLFEGVLFACFLFF